MTRSNAEPVGDGLVLVDKPAEWTSHDVVARMRRLAGTRKIGHAGTLDPMATGLLVLGVNRATRLLTYLVGADKEYTATVRLGQDTVTDDAEGEITRSPGAAHPGELTTRLPAAVLGLTGTIDQVPSAVSAIKVNGQRSYARVRAGQEVALTARQITVHTFEVTGSRPAVADDGTAVLDLDVRVECSSGTYVRALARDLGAELGTGGHLTALRRHRVGPFDLQGAHTLTELAERVDLLSVTDALRARFPARELTAAEARAVRYGQKLDATGSSGVIAAFDPDGHGIALLTDNDAGNLARPVLVLDPA
ncbi:tRNA pseudouridine(55) synthase TruB [Ruania zhangjianzhongii]|uniref:tRNA pseudouridine(55) synthase TruB n=1 Tax=Ruania zhangjianzhongii TaxID=2603206 RepID=UPI0011CB76EC|nr:tRNA pseudouridine(55) synthase TruB [Ruania zhangjianzhongii]